MLALDGGDLAASGQEVVAGPGGDVVDMDDDAQAVAGAHRAGVHEALLGVDDAGPVEAELRVEGDLLDAPRVTRIAKVGGAMTSG